MTKTEEIMELVDACADAAVRDYLSGNGEASYHCDKLKSAIEELVAELDLEKTNTAIYLEGVRIQHDRLREDNNRLALIIFDHELADYEGEAAELHAQILEQRRVIESMQPRTIGNVGTACGEYVECSGRPDAPHGVDVDASLRAGKTVCLCASWAPGEAS